MKTQNRPSRPETKDASHSFVQNQHHCVLCEKPLELKTDVVAAEFKVIERAYCHSCGVHTRVKEHALH